MSCICSTEFLTFSSLLLRFQNYFYKFIDTAIIVVAGVVISAMQGATTLTVDIDPSTIRLEYLITENPKEILDEENKFFKQLFAFAAGANEDFQQ